MTKTETEFDSKFCKAGFVHKCIIQTAFVHFNRTDLAEPHLLSL